MDASTTIELPTQAETSGESGCGQPDHGDSAGAHWTTARTFAFCRHCGKPVGPGDRVLRFTATGNEYCYRAHCAELQWLVHLEAEDEAREREDWARSHATVQALCIAAE